MCARVCVCVAAEIDRGGIVCLSPGGARWGVCRKSFTAGCQSFCFSGSDEK